MIQHYLSYFFSEYVSDNNGMVHEWLRLDGWTISKVVICCFSFYLYPHNIPATVAMSRHDAWD